MFPLRGSQVVEPGGRFTVRVTDSAGHRLALSVVTIDPGGHAVRRLVRGSDTLAAGHDITVKPGHAYLIELLGVSQGSLRPKRSPWVQIDLSGRAGERRWFDERCAPWRQRESLATYGTWQIAAAEPREGSHSSGWRQYELPVNPDWEAMEWMGPKSEPSPLTVEPQEFSRVSEFVMGGRDSMRVSIGKVTISSDQLDPMLAKLGTSFATELEEPINTGGGGDDTPVEAVDAPTSLEPPIWFGGLPSALSPEDVLAPREHTPPERVVSTGFAAVDRPAAPHDPRQPLAIDEPWYFWFEVGQPVNNRADREMVTIHTELPVGARITVILFSFDDGFLLEDGRDRGELTLGNDGRFTVSLPVIEPDGLGDEAIRRHRLFFPVRTPPRQGLARLRCSICHRGVLLQSHLVEAQVLRPAKLATYNWWARIDTAIATRLDYKLAEALDARILYRVEPHRLNLLLNDNGDGTHGFRVYGADDEIVFKNDATFTGEELKTKIDTGRRALRFVSWGAESEWNGEPFLYETPPSRGQLLRDLIRLAKWGRRFYVDLVDRLVGGPGLGPVEVRRRRHQLEQLMRNPGRVQIASKVSVRHILPAALIYDAKLADDVVSTDHFELCPVFAAALDHGEPLANTVCLNGKCPVREERFKVCPSGFWGFRHEIGFPTTDKRDAKLVIEYTDQARVIVSVSTDRAFQRRARHEKNLRAMLVSNDAWRYADDRDRSLELMKAGGAQLVYFYCHGGLSDDVPYLEVGPKNAVEKITRATLFDADILWEHDPPLVFINGCHTTALKPEVVTELVSGFRDCNAVGVIGTEITIFEPLAVAFAESFFAQFLAGEEVGAAIRRARLHLLAQGNPLGLVYIPFVLASVKLSRRPPVSG